MTECVIFDFDETLTTRDTTRIWLSAFARVFPMRTALNTFSIYDFIRNKNNSETCQSFKFKMIGSLLQGLTPDALSPVNQIYAHNVRSILRSVTWNALEEHLNSGRIVLVVTASFQDSVISVFKGTKIEVIGTQFVTENNFFTGMLVGQGCFGERKKDLIESWAQNKSNSITFIEAWTDNLSDASMLSLSKTRCWICPPAHRSEVIAIDPAAKIIDGLVS